VSQRQALQIRRTSITDASHVALNPTELLLDVGEFLSWRQIAISNNCPRCQGLSSTLRHALREERHFALVDGDKHLFEKMAGSKVTMTGRLNGGRFEVEAIAPVKKQVARARNPVERNRDADSTALRPPFVGRPSAQPKPA
jgi:hypothetical protein